MKKFWKRGFSLLLALCMMFSLVPAGAWAGYAGACKEGESYFDFDAADYSVREDNQTLRVKIVRHGEGTTPANVAVKVADFLSTYGEDYEVLLDGEVLSMQEGTVIDPSDFVFNDGEDEAQTGAASAPAKADDAAEAEEAVEAVQAEEVEETVEAVETAEAFDADDAEELAAEEAEEAEAGEEIAALKRSGSGAAAVDLFSYRAGGAEELAEELVGEDAEAVTDEADEAAAEAVTEEADEAAAETASLQDEAPAKRSKSASPLREMQAAYLNLPEKSDSVELMEQGAPDMFENMHEFFEKAQGATAVVYFGPGVCERVLTVRTKDNDEADGSRMFLIGLLGTDTEETSIAPNPTTYVQIEDDDDYEPATFSIMDSNVVLTREAPGAQITITRKGGTQYFATAYVSTVKDTAKAGSYAEMDQKAVGFIPGQTEAQVTVTAQDFTQDGKFGIRLESDSLDSVDNHYVDVKIMADETAELADVDDGSDPYGLGFAYEIATPEEAEAYYERMASSRIPVSVSEAKGTVEVLGEAALQGASLQAAAEPEDGKEEAELQSLPHAISGYDIIYDERELPSVDSESWTMDVQAGNGRMAVIPLIVPVDGTYVFESINTSGDPYGSIVGADFISEWAYDDDGGEGRNFRITMDLPANTPCFLAVRWWNNDGNYGVIRVKATLQSRTATVLDQPVAGGSPVTATESIVRGGQINYLRFTPTVTGRYIFESTNTSGDPYGYLYNADKTTTLAYNDDGAGNRNFKIEYDLTAGTTYYFGVKHYSNSATGDINCKLSVVAPIYLGQSFIGYGHYQPNSFAAYGWDGEKTGSDKNNRAEVGDQLYVAQYDDGKYSMLSSKGKWGFYGIYNIHFSMCVAGDGSKHFTVFHADSDKTWPGHVGNEYRQDGNSGWAERDLDVRRLRGEYYLKFGAGATSTGKNNPRSWLDWFRYEYTKYTFDWKDSCEGFFCKLYDFTSTAEPLQTLNVYYPKATEDDESGPYYPGPLQSAVTMNGYSYPVLGFYATYYNQNIVMTDPKAELNNSRGLILKGVYLAKFDKGYSDMYDNRNNSYKTGNSYFVAAQNGTVTIRINNEFLNNLMNAGVINADEAPEERINVYPVYERTNVEVHFENTDRPNGSLRYDENYEASHLMNIVEAYNRGSYGIQKRNWRGMDYYSMSVPTGSIIRVKSVPVAERSAAGVRWWEITGSNDRNGVAYYQSGQTVAEPGRTEERRLTETDYTLADITVTRHTSMAPATGTQSFYVGYSPRSVSQARTNQSITSTGSLKEAVINITDGIPSREELVYGTNATDDNGAMNLTGSRINKQYTLKANAPANFYTYWANMTGDNDNNGEITDEETNAQSKITDKSDNPRYVYGDQLFLTQDQDNMRYYYLFLPKTNDASVTAEGIVRRKKNTLLRLATGEESLGYTPIAGAYVNVAGFTGMTDGNGEYDIELKGSVADWGNVSMQVIPQGGGQTYSTVTAIERYSKVEFPALEVFSAVPNNSSTTGVGAAYSNSENADSINTAGIMVKDDTLTITVSVRHNAAIIASKAHFAFYNSEGSKRFDCDGREGYTTTTRGGSALTATLSFNPKRDIKAGDRLWVSFEDQTGKVYAPIDVGYQFAAELTLDQFIFPMLGSSTLENAYRNLESIDIIGNPLGDFELGSVPGNLVPEIPPEIDDIVDINLPTPNINIPSFKADSQYYKPVPNYDVGWMQTDYTFGWSQTFPSNPLINSQNTDENADVMKEVLDELKDMDAPDVGAAAGSGGFSASGDFSCSFTPSIGFRLRISQRNTAQNQGNYFEDLFFYFKMEWDVAPSISIATPIGIDILIDLGTDGMFMGAYHMYMDYPEEFHQYGAQEWSSESFSLFANKPSTSRYLRREGYLFLDPGFTVGVGVGVYVAHVKCSAHFAFDSEYRFRSGGIDAYCDLTYDIDWTFDVCGFTIYKFRTPFNQAASLIAGHDVNIQTIPLFHTPGQNGHIEFSDLGLQSTTQAALQDVMSGSLTGARNASLKDAKPASRAYLEYRGEWQQPGDQVSLMNAEGSEESELLAGTADNMSVNLVPVGSEGDLLMVYVDDGGTTRANPNKRAVYYSVYTASSGTWSDPAIIYDDGTPDEYPTAQDLGNGQIFVAWSSAAMAMPENATVEDMLTAMDLQAAFFDTESRTFGDVTALTRTTGRDYDVAADLMPKAAYDAETGRIILYYTKTEFIDLEGLADISTAFSDVAYLFYQYDQNEDGTWAATGAWRNTGDDYTEEELDNFRQALDLDDAGVEAYKNGWYGQRALDTRLNTDSDTVPRVVDSSAIGYNGLALYAYTVDWDGSLDSSNDRDVFLQIYNFSEDSFSHIIRVTRESGAYTLPQFARSNNSTYLFYGEKTQENAQGAIRYLNISYLIRNEFYEKITNGSNEYYVLRMTRPAVEYEDPDGETVVLPEETVDVTGDIAAKCGSLSDFDVFVAEDGRMYLLWSASDNEDGCEIYAAVFNATDEADEETDDEDGEETEAAWSGPVAITDGGEDVFYTGIGAIGYEGQILAVAGKQELVQRARESDGDNTVRNSLIQVLHTPFSRAELDEAISVDNYYPAAGELVTVTAKLNNVGLDTIPSSEDGIVIALQVNGEDAGEAVYNGSIAGGTSVDVTASVEVPDAENVTITAFYEGVTASVDLLKGAIFSVENGAFGYATETMEAEEETISEGTRIYSAEIANVGNIPSESAVFTVSAGETTLGSAAVPALEAKGQARVVVALDVPDDVWQIGEDGIGIAEAVVSGVSGDEEIFRDTQTISKAFDAEAVSLLSAYQSSGSVDSPSATVAQFDMIQVEPVIQGVDGLTVEWLYSDDGSIASIDYSNGIYGESLGTTTIHGILVPAREVLTFDGNGQGSRTDWTTLIPEGLQVEVTATVTVQEAEEEPTPTLTPATQPTTTPTGTQPTTAPTGTQPTTAPTGTQPTTAPTGAPGTPTPTPTPVPAKQGCYVATCVYGSYDCPEVWTLRRLRDEVLADTWYGRLFIHAYYAVSPTVVRLFGNCDWFQNFCRAKLDQIVATLQAEGFASTPYNDPQW